MEVAEKESRYDIEVVSRYVEKMLPERESGVVPGNYVEVRTTRTAIVRGAKLQHERPAPLSPVSVIKDSGRIPSPPLHGPSIPVRYFVQDVYDASWKKVGQLPKNEHGYLRLAGTVALLKQGDRLMVD